MAKILLVDDNEDSRYIISRLLIRNGYDVVMATDGSAGVRMVATEKPDLVIMDLALPSIDGFEATRRIKASPETGSIPIIALTAFYAASGDEERAREAGCDDYDTKPVDPGSLLSKIERLIALSQH